LLDRPDEGEIYLSDRPLAHGDDDERTHARNAAIGFVFQFHFLLAEFSALENVMLPMRKLGLLTQAEMRERGQHLLEQVGIGNKADRMANQLSGGEQQRVAIARSLANSPAVLLADEPTGNLDAANSGIVFDLLQKVASEMGQAVVIVTHNLDLAHRCNRVLTMQDGQFIGEKQG
jgi:lipoprotein-releasing system ATP-binding protein